MIDLRTARFAALLLRLAPGALFLVHAGLKILVLTPAGTARLFASLALPPARAYTAMTIETMGGMALLPGIWTRWAALALVPVLLGAVVFVHGPAGLFFTNPNRGCEYPAFWAAALLVQSLFGDGTYALRPRGNPARRPLAAH